MFVCRIELRVYLDAFDVGESVYGQIKMFSHKGVWGFFADSLFLVVES